jgi:hypothetical protein
VRVVGVEGAVRDAADARVRVAAGFLEERRDAPPLRRYRDEEAFGERRELRAAEAIRPLPVVGERPHRDQEGGGPDPHVTFVAHDDELLAEPGDCAKPLACLAGLAGEELERHERTTLREKVSAPQAERARAVVEDGEAIHDGLRWRWRQRR